MKKDILNQRINLTNYTTIKVGGVTEYFCEPNSFDEFSYLIEWSNSNNHDHEFETMWERIDELEPFERKIFRYKFDFHFNKIRSNIEISKLMSCSEEYVRLSLKNRIKKLCNKYYKNS